MKKIFAIVVCVIMSVSANAQSEETKAFERNGNTFSFTSTAKRKAVKDTLVTQFEWEDANNNKYPIIVNRQSGRCYIYKTSKKTGRLYKQYMKTEVSKAICKELGITFVETKD